VGEKIEQKLSKIYKKIGYTAAFEHCSLILREYSMELTVVVN